MGNIINWIFCDTRISNGWASRLILWWRFSQLGVQALGIFTSGLYAFVVSFVILLVMKWIMGGLRVTAEEEVIGLDMSEHGSYGYPEVFESRDKASKV